MRWSDGRSKDHDKSQRNACLNDRAENDIAQDSPQKKFQHVARSPRKRSLLPALLKDNPTAGAWEILNSRLYNRGRQAYASLTTRCVRADRRTPGKNGA